MRYRALSLLFLIICLLTASCGAEEKLPTRKAAEYAEKTLEAQLPLQMTVDCENCDLEVYRWIRKEVRFEYTESVSGGFSEEALTDKLKRFKTEIRSDDKKVSFRSRFSGPEKMNGKLVLRIYLPKKTGRLEFIYKKGKLRLYDDIKGELVIRADKLDAEISKLDGKLDCNIKEGDFKLADGRLSDGSKVVTGRGNIKIKSRYEPLGTYQFVSREGLLDIFMPDDLIAHFTEDLPPEFAGEEYFIGDISETKYSGNESDIYAVNFKLESGSDMIRITRF